MTFKCIPRPIFMTTYLRMNDVQCTSNYSCILELITWFTINSLQINPTKTQIIYISQNKTSKPLPFTFTFVGTSIKSSPCRSPITNLCVIFDHSLDMNTFISHKIRNINNQLYCIKKSLNFFLVQF